MYIKLTEFMEKVSIRLVTKFGALTATTQTPHPPSKHINFVPVNLAYSRMYVLSVVSLGTTSGST